MTHAKAVRQSADARRRTLDVLPELRLASQADAILATVVHRRATIAFMTTSAKPSPAPVCDRCGSTKLVKVKGCVRCEDCGYKADCNGW
jgi:hypothetical protein